MMPCSAISSPVGSWAASAASGKCYPLPIPLNPLAEPDNMQSTCRRVSPYCPVACPAPVAAPAAAAHYAAFMRSLRVCVIYTLYKIKNLNGPDFKFHVIVCGFSRSPPVWTGLCIVKCFRIYGLSH